MVSDWLKWLVCWLVSGLVLLALSGGANAAPDEAALCDAAAYQAAGASGIPPVVMQALTLTETGRLNDGRLRPWPWAVNYKGQGYWFDSKEEVLSFARARIAEGNLSFDLGCFQINYRWHGQHFLTLEQMVDPRTNASYAARFLGELHSELGSWDKAAGAYHSRTSALASRYSARFSRIIAGLSGAPVQPVNELAEPPPLNIAASPSPYASNPAPLVASGVLGSLASGLAAHTGEPFLVQAPGSLF